MATDSVIRRFAAAADAEDAEDWAQAIPSSISAAFSNDLAEGPKRERDGEILPHAAQDLLTALAWSAGNGMPARGSGRRRLRPSPPATPCTDPRTWTGC